jgi:hypothetical protein
MTTARRANDNHTGCLHSFWAEAADFTSLCTSQRSSGAHRTSPSGVGECGEADIGAEGRLGRKTSPETGRVAVLPLSARRTGSRQPTNCTVLE